MGVFREDIAAALPRLRAFARSLARDVHLADDLVQDTLASALRAGHQFTPGTNLEAWLFTILRNRFRTVARRERRGVEVADGEAGDAWGTPPPQAALLEVLAFREGFRQLDPSQREVLVLVGVEGLTYERTAAVCGCEIGTVKSRINRARGRLKRLMLGEEGLPPPAGWRRRRGATEGRPAGRGPSTPAPAAMAGADPE